MKNKTQIIILCLIVLSLIAGVFLYVGKSRHVELAPPGTGSTTGGGVTTGPTEEQSKEVQTIHIAKEVFDNGANKDLDLSVGSTYGNFKIVKIVDTPRGPNRIHFSGEETLKGKLQFSSFLGGFYFTVDNSELEKLPQVLKGIYEKPLLIDVLAINEPSKISRSDFIFKESGESNTVAAEVKISNVTLGIPAVDIFGSADATEVRILKN